LNILLKEKGFENATYAGRGFCGATSTGSQKLNEYQFGKFLTEAFGGVYTKTTKDFSAFWNL